MTIIGAINDVVHVTKPAAPAMPLFTLTTHTKPPTTTLKVLSMSLAAQGARALVLQLSANLLSMAVTIPLLKATPGKPRAAGCAALLGPSGVPPCLKVAALLALVHGRAPREGVLHHGCDLGHEEGQVGEHLPPTK